MEEINLDVSRQSENPKRSMTSRPFTQKWADDATGASMVHRWLDLEAVTVKGHSLPVHQHNPQRLRRRNRPKRKRSSHGRQSKASVRKLAEKWAGI